jgi:hypothetical protein
MDEKKLLKSKNQVIGKNLVRQFHSTTLIILKLS